jgi:hypothetical protein
VSDPRRYGVVHKKARRRWAPRVRAGKVDCWRCRKPIAPGAPWDLGHVEGAAAVAEFGARYPEHRRCNRATLPRMLAEARGEAPHRAPGSNEPRFGGLPDPTPGNSVERWSRHWSGGFNPRCPDCRARGSACEKAEAA